MIPQYQYPEQSVRQSKHGTYWRQEGEEAEGEGEGDREVEGWSEQGWPGWSEGCGGREDGCSLPSGLLHHPGPPGPQLDWPEPPRPAPTAAKCQSQISDLGGAQETTATSRPAGT